MTRFTLASLLLAASLGGSAFSAGKGGAVTADRPANKPTVKSSHDVQNLLYLADDRLVVFRLHVRVDGKSYKTAWRERIDAYFKELDGNGDGKLTGREITAIPSYADLARTNLLSRRTGPRLPTVSASAADSNPRDGTVTRKELADYLQRVGVAPFSVQIANANRNQSFRVALRGRSSNSAGKRLFKLLDTNDDGKLSVAELKAAAKSLRKSDLDEDETISAAELSPASSPFVFSASMAGTRSANNTRFLSLSTGESTAQVVRKLIQRYDRRTGGANGDGRLSPGELKIDPTAFAPYDADKDGSLDFDELEQFLRNPPAGIEMIVRLGNRKPGEKLISIVHVEPGLKSQLKGVTDRMANLRLRNAHLELASGSSSGWGVSETAYDRQFDAADTDNNGYLTREESRRNGFFSRVFAQMDADGDGKVFKKEMRAYVRRQMNLALSRTIFNIADQGRDLFKILDLDQDQRLSRRELELAPGRVEAWDDDGDRQIAVAEVPRQYRLSVDRGSPGGIFGIARPVVAYPGGPRMRVSRSAAGPKWFSRMDLNQDGEVSRREFLGTLRQFQQLDVDGDGRLDLNEAAAAARRSSSPAAARKPAAKS